MAPEGPIRRREAPYTVTTVVGPPAPAEHDRRPGHGVTGRRTDPVPAAEARAEHGGGATVETREPAAGARSSAGPTPRGQRRRLALSGVPGHVAKGRDFTRRALRDWGWGGTETSEDALLVVSELLTNASLHADGRLELVLSAGETALRIEVHDRTTTLPVRRPAPRPGVPGGRGLHIVERLTDHWGAQAYGTGKAVWAEIEASRLSREVTAER
ncbi:ATP-binding protein [Streptomyces erythrochromogenes]|uniref:ATP-binding protein n=1 Tax=Streptomyces erythrochromogenes TaxID=285574 RepID=UPI0037FEA6D3